MVNPLYWVSALTYAIVLGMILIHDIFLNRPQGKVEKTFRRLLIAVIWFCLQDTVWGICGGTWIKNDQVFFVSSFVFHASTVGTSFFWLDYMLTYLGEKILNREKYLMLDGAIIGVQGVLLILNCFSPVIYSIQNGIYVTERFRPVVFFNQYIVYLAMGLLAAWNVFRVKGEQQKKYMTVLFFSGAPILSGVFQLKYPNGPFYSLGYFLGCFMIHIFIVSKERDALIQVQYEKERTDSARKFAEQIVISNTDELTGLLNRRAYEEDLRRFSSFDSGEDFVYVSADVNGLKIINDSMGHASGDELLKGAAWCLRQCIEPYGRIYRIGGDEFAAMIAADSAAVASIRRNLVEMSAEWTGETVRELAISFGFATKREFPNMPVSQMAKVADDRMYRAKAAYYTSKGIDRRWQQSAYAALCASYTKILRINLTNDSFQIICMDLKEQTREKGFSDHISKWLHDFGTSGQVHQEDLKNYLEKTNLQHLKEFFSDGKQEISIFYRRKTGDQFRKVLMEMIRAEDYEDDNQSLYLYVKDING